MFTGRPGQGKQLLHKLRGHSVLSLTPGVPGTPVPLVLVVSPELITTCGTIWYQKVRSKDDTELCNTTQRSLICFPRYVYLLSVWGWLV